MKKVLFIISIALFSCAAKNDTPTITAIYPSGDTLPENLLRMYVRFSDPMKTVGNLENIRIVDRQGKEVKGSIFNNAYELWDESQKQLTLIFDPARVKTGLRVNETLGRALKPHQAYQLIIENLETVEHIKLATYVKNFYVTLTDDTRPNTTKWNIYTPEVGSSNPLTVTLREPADWMSLLHRIRIVNEKDEYITGSIKIRRQEKEWVFTPDKKWKSGNYFMHINARFADPCGNNLNGLFDHKSGTLRFKSEDEIIKIPFSL